MKLFALAGRYAVCRLGPQGGVPARALAGSFFTVTRTPDELSLVCEEEHAPAGARCERDFRALGVRGPLDFALVGVLAGLTGALAEANVSLFAISTFDTDYLLVRDRDFTRALAALRAAGHEIEG